MNENVNELPANDVDVRRLWDEIASQVRHHRDLYYNSQPVISDAEFDELFQRLVRLEEEHPELAVPDSPTMRSVRRPAVRSTMSSTSSG